MNAFSVSELTKLVKGKSKELGLDICGIAPAKVMDINKGVLKSWCEAGMNGKMSYLGRNTDKRADPSLHLPGVKSIVVTGMSYNSGKHQKAPGVPIVSRYAYGRRYQDVISSKLEALLVFINKYLPAEGKIVVDSAPFFEKAWAVEAGLGWQGKHSIIINREIGSFFFLGILMLDIELEYDAPEKADHCGTCRFCIDKCPTGAINGNRTIDTRKCISNLTIENREPVDESLAPLIGKRVYGCDICQEVCPWNRKATTINHPEYSISRELAEMTPDEWLSLTEERYDSLFQNSPVGRVKYKTFLSNIRLVMKSPVSGQ